jgi:hypothetical protein
MRYNTTFCRRFILGGGFLTSYGIDVSNRDTFKDAIHRIMEKPESDYAEKLKIIDQNMHLLNHTQPYMFDRFMAEFAKELKLQ